jgi:inositol-hexakisphosphate kinase
MYDSDEAASAAMVSRSAEPVGGMPLAPDCVAVHMIDFAHTTHSGFYDDTVVHSGPDSGYLFGLHNLIDLFHQLLAESD